MKNILSIVACAFLFQACSSTQPKNNWQYQASSFLNDYTKHYLQGDVLRAKVYLSHARQKATKSANLHTLIDIELSACATRLSALEENSCKNAADLLILDPDPFQQAYLDLLRSELSASQIKDLPDQYQDFASALLEDDVKKLNEEAASISPLSSKLLASALIKDRLDDKNIQGLIETLSFHGYKTPLLAWLRLQMQNEKEHEKKARMKEKLEVLISH